MSLLTAVESFIWGLPWARGPLQIFGQWLKGQTSADLGVSGAYLYKYSQNDLLNKDAAGKLPVFIT
jgi:hypothetical protein